MGYSPEVLERRRERHREYMKKRYAEDEAYRETKKAIAQERRITRRDADRVAGIDKVCTVCGAAFNVTPKRWQTKQCSTECLAEHKRLYENARREEPLVRLRCGIRRSMWASLKGQKGGHKWEALVGYTVHELKAHLEGLFAEGMSWENYGLHGWHIDHIKPLSSFSEDDIMEAWRLENLQPLWSWDNWSKGSKV